MWKNHIDPQIGYFFSVSINLVKDSYLLEQIMSEIEI